MIQIKELTYILTLRQCITKTRISEIWCTILNVLLTCLETFYPDGNKIYSRSPQRSAENNCPTVLLSILAAETITISAQYYLPSPFPCLCETTDFSIRSMAVGATFILSKSTIILEYR